MFSNQHVILHFTSGDKRHTTSSILKACNWEPGGRGQTQECCCLLPNALWGGSQPKYRRTGPSSTSQHRAQVWNPAISPTFTVPSDPPRAISSRETLGASTHLCPFLSQYRCHTVISPMASAPGPDGPVTWPQLLPKVQSQGRW